MQETVNELRQLIIRFREKLTALDETSFSAKPLPNKWSKKEVLGHLIDSAHNNIRRFICGQYDDPVDRITYDQDFWVHANQYQKMKNEEIIQLWALMNERICAVLENMPRDKFSAQVNTGKISPELHPLEFLAADYVKHLRHHLNQIFRNSFDLVYP